MSPGIGSHRTREVVVLVTGVKQREAWLAGQQPPVERLRAGLWTIPIPIPDNPLRYTLAYLVAFTDAIVLVDPGWDSAAGRSALEAGLASMGALMQDVAGLVVTHVHPDHHGMSAHVREVSGAWVAMHPLEHRSLPKRTVDFPLQDARDRGWLEQCGVPPAVVEELSIPPEVLLDFHSMAEPDITIEDGQPIPETGGRLRAVWTPGHTPGHLCLYDESEDVLLSGDHVLPRISPNIGHRADTDYPPLAEYLASLERIAAYDSAEVLPAHEYRFHGLASRCRQLQRHHAERCAEIMTKMTEVGSSTVWELSERLTWSRGWRGVEGLMRRAAIAETLAHVNYLRDLGLITEVESKGGPRMYSTGRVGGIARF
jgi:glyoxylase-like metal-dependent hydrolase (beta-lactamase superfamily II)